MKQGLSGTPQRFSAPQRQASLLRFREKRKGRNFDKTIRYTVRKEVALRYAPLCPKIITRFCLYLSIFFKIRCFVIKRFRFPNAGCSVRKVSSHLPNQAMRNLH